MGDGGDDGPAWEEQRLFDVPLVQSAPKRRRRRTGAVEAREFGGWTLDKLQILQQYFKMYRRVAGSGTYIDAFAGGGTARINGQLVDGSPKIAVNSGAFKRLFLIDVDSKLTTTLTTELATHKHNDRCTVICGDSNVEIGRLLDSGTIDPTKPCFAFLDPNSTQLAWSTIEALARYKTMGEATGECKVELWILFNEQQAIQRLWPRDKSNLPPFAAVLDRVMGERAAWLDLWSAGRGPQWLVRRDADRLRELGYRNVALQQILDPSSGRAQYWMVHASDHDAAMSLMRWAKRTSSISYSTEPFAGMDL